MIPSSACPNSATDRSPRPCRASWSPAGSYTTPRDTTEKFGLMCCRDFDHPQINPDQPMGPLYPLDKRVASKVSFPMVAWVSTRLPRNGEGRLIWQLSG
jgi:hypothetical protein